MKYRQKEIVEATRWFKLGDHPKVVQEEGKGKCIYCKMSLPFQHGRIHNIGVSYRVCYGQWIVEYENGEFEVMNDEYFTATYEEVK